LLVPPLAGELAVAHAAEPVDQLVDRGAELRRGVALRAFELLVRDEDPRP
jgi:hypothetical protein